MKIADRDWVTCRWASGRCGKFICRLFEAGVKEGGRLVVDGFVQTKQRSLRFGERLLA